jgi:hypothetical protein
MQAVHGSTQVLQKEVKVLFSKFFMRTEVPSVPGKAKQMFSVGVRLLLMS